MKYLNIALLGLLCMACGHKPAEQPASLEVHMRAAGGESFHLPRASAFRMSGDYADKVAVTLNPDGTLAYYPDPKDISEMSAPVNLGNGWWLNRQGVADGSVFTNWTFEDYSRLDKVPSREDIINSIIPNARITEIKVLPLSLSEALADPSRCRIYTDY